MHSSSQSRPSPALTEAARQLQNLGADRFELYMVRKSATRIDCKDQKVESLSRSEDVGLSVRILKDQRLGFSFTTSLEPLAVERACKSAVEIAALMEPDEHHSFHSFSTSAYPDVDARDEQGLAAAMDSKIAMAMKMEADCRATDKRIQAVRSSTLSESFYQVQMLDSSGDLISQQGTLYSASISCKAEQDGDSQMGGEFGFSNYLDQLDVSKIGRMGAEQATELLGAGKPDTMKCPALIRNSVVAELLEFLSSSFSAEEIDKGRSMLAGKQGQRVFSEHVSLIDDGLLQGGYATSSFDGEGVPCQKTTLVSGGFFEAALYDLYHAKKLGSKPTGSASRGTKSPPSIGVSNFYMPAGKKSLEQLQKSVGKGILITDLMGVHTANPITGDFSLGASGILIENGELTRPVRGFAVAGNVLELFRRVSDLGQDLRFFGSVGAPSMLVSELSVGGA